MTEPMHVRRQKSDDEHQNAADQTDAADLSANHAVIDAVDANQATPQMRTKKGPFHFRRSLSSGEKALARAARAKR